MQTWSEAMDTGWTSHLLPPEITAEEYDALPEEVARRIEVVDGRIIVSPSASLLHQLIVAGLLTELRSQRPVGPRVVGEVDVRLADVPLRIRKPDVIVFHGDLETDLAHAILRPEHVSLVVEVVSPNSVTIDRLHKFGEYAAAGIANYWRIETDPLEVHTYALAKRAYRETGVHKGRLVTDRPFPVDVDLDALLLG